MIKIPKVNQSLSWETLYYLPQAYTQITKGIEQDKLSLLCIFIYIKMCCLMFRSTVLIQCLYNKENHNIE